MAYSFRSKRRARVHFATKAKGARSQRMFVAHTLLAARALGVEGAVGFTQRRAPRNSAEVEICEPRVRNCRV
jgi:hypothetical protein